LFFVEKDLHLLSTYKWPESSKNCWVFFFKKLAFNVNLGVSLPYIHMGGETFDARKYG